MKGSVRNVAGRYAECVIDMSKYEPLWRHIQITDSSVLTFDDIEKVCGFPVDHSFLNAKKELEAYGYQVGKISMKERTVRIQEIPK